MSFFVSIKEYEVVEDHIEYVLEVFDRDSGDSWKFNRRYSFLRNAHYQIRALDSHVPEFPPKKIFGSMNPKFLQKRRNELEVYFKEIVKLPTLTEMPFVRTLLKPVDSLSSNSYRKAI